MSNNQRPDFKAKVLLNGKKKLRDAPGVKRTGKGDELRWRDVEPNRVMEMLGAVSESGGAPMFIRSSDGGALGLRVYHDEVKLENAWATSIEEVEELLTEIALDYLGHSALED